MRANFCANIAKAGRTFPKSQKNTDVKRNTDLSQDYRLAFFLAIISLARLKSIDIIQQLFC